MASIKEIIFRIRPKTKEAEASLRKMSKDTKNFDTQVRKAGKSMDMFGGSIKKIGATIAGAFAVQQVIAFGRASLEAFDKQQKAEQKLLVALKGRQDVQQRLIKQAQDLQKITLFGDEATIQAQAFLASMGLTEEAIRRLTPLVQDLATKSNMDLASAADLVAKSVGSSTNALSRYAIDMEGAAGSSERLESAIESLNEKVGGQAQAAAQVGTASLEQIEMRIGDLQEKIGELILRGLDPLVPHMNSVVDASEKMIPIFNRVADNLPLLFLGAPGILTAWTKAIFDIGEETDKFADDLKKAQTSAAGNNEETVKSIVTIESLKEEIKKLQKEMETTDVTTKEFTSTKAELAAKEEQLAKLTGKTTDKMKEQKEAMKELQEQNKEFREKVFEDIEEAEKNIDDLLANLITDDLARQETKLQIEAERELKALEESLASDEQKASLKLLIEQNLAKDIAELRLQTQQDEDERRKKEKEDEDKAQQERIDKEKEAADKIREIRRKQSEDVLRFTINSINKALDFQTKAIEMEIDAQQVRVNTAAELAKEGNVKQLKLEEERLQDLQEKRRKALEAERAIAALEIAINTALTISNIIRAASLTAAQTGAASPVTIPITLAAIGGAAAIAGTLFTPPGFAEGTEKVMGGGSETSDSVPALLSRGERVVTARKNREYWDSLSAIHNGTIPARELNDFVNNYTFERKPFTNTVVPILNNKITDSKLDAIADILKRQRGATFNIDENGIYAVVDRIRTRNNRIRKYLA